MLAFPNDAFMAGADSRTRPTLVARRIGGTQALNAASSQDPSAGTRIDKVALFSSNNNIYLFLGNSINTPLTGTAKKAHYSGRRKGLEGCANVATLLLTNDR